MKRVLRALATVAAIASVVFVAWFIWALGDFTGWWGPRGAFLADLDRVKPGMTEPEVEAILGKYMRGSGWRLPPEAVPERGELVELGPGGPRSYGYRTDAAGQLEIAGTVIYRHSDEAAYNSDWGIVTYRDGRVVGVEFSPD